MILLLLGVVGTVVAFQLWNRLLALHDTVAALTTRLERLEQLRSRDERAAVTRIAPAAAADPAPVRPPTPPPVAPPVPVAPRVPAARPAPAARPIQPEHIPAPPVRPSVQQDTRDAIETRIGTRWLLYIGVAAIVVGVAYFEKLAIDNHWVSDTARAIQGGLLGVAFIVAGLRFTRAGYRLYGQLVSGCGVAVLYVVIYAAFNMYHLISQMPAFALMSVVTLIAAWLADRQRSQGLALAAVGGGFVTPFLLGSGSDAEVALFGYDAILIAGTMLLARRREWPALNIVSYGFTVLTVCAWASSFYIDAKYLTTELFLTLFCGMFLYILHTARQSSHRAAQAERFILWTAPFAYYAASISILNTHSTALLIYLILMSLAGVLIGARVDARVRLAFWAAAAWPLLAWTDSLTAGSSWLLPGLVTWSVVYALNGAGVLEGVIRRGRALGVADIVLLHLNTLIAFLGAYMLLQRAGVSAAPSLAAGFALFQGVPFGVSWRRRREAALQFAVPAFALMSMAIALQLHGQWFATGWIAESAGVIWLGLSERRAWLRRTGLGGAAIGVLMLLAILFSDPLAGQLTLLNERAALGVFAIALAYALTWAHGRLSLPERRATETSIALVAAKLMILAVAAGEIVAYWRLHPPPPFEPASQLIATGFVIGAVVMWLGLKRRQEWARGIGGAAIAISAFALFVIQVATAPPEYRAILNGRVGAGVFAVVVLYILTRLHRDFGGAVQDLPVNIAAMTTGASLLTLSLLTSEINAFWATRGATATLSISRDALQAMAWAGVGGFIVWRGLLSRITWVRVVGAALLALAVVRVVVVQIASPGIGYLVIANARTLAALVLIAILFGLARLYLRAEDTAESRHVVAALRLVANAIGLLLLTSEITAYWHLEDLRRLPISGRGDSYLAREMMLSITWAVYATILVVVGLRKRYAPIRYFAIAVFVVTIVKVFAVDLADLDRLYRVASILGLGILLLLTAFLYQRLRVGNTAEARR